jgi:hypothetical protein
MESNFESRKATFTSQPANLIHVVQPTTVFYQKGKTV